MFGMELSSHSSNILSGDGDRGKCGLDWRGIGVDWGGRGWGGRVGERGGGGSCLPPPVGGLAGWCVHWFDRRGRYYMVRFSSTSETQIYILFLDVMCPAHTFYSVLWCCCLADFCPPPVPPPSRPTPRVGGGGGQEPGSAAAA